jgi:hypothetical protein
MLRDKGFQRRGSVYQHRFVAAFVDHRRIAVGDWAPSFWADRVNPKRMNVNGPPAQYFDSSSNLASAASGASPSVTRRAITLVRVVAEWQ